MKTELKAKFLQHLLNKKNGNEGFTLIELLVVIIIIGILAAIALPSFLNQANKARESEAKTYVGSMNRAQQAYYLEENEFAADLKTLKIGIPETTGYYKYATAATSKVLATSTGTQTKGTVRTFTGKVEIDATNNTTTATVSP
jgi:type IV pilus assembly protein PilA